jgi:hypothetical protein
VAFKEITVGNGFENEIRVQFNEVGDSVEGRLIESTTLQSRDGDPFKKYVLQSGSEKKSFFGCYVLDKTLPTLALGTLVKITFQGRERIKGGKTLKSFQILADDSTDSVSEST